MIFVSKKYTPKEMLAVLHRESGSKLSFNNYITELRKKYALKYGYIMSAVDYEDILMCLIRKGIVSPKVIFQLKSIDEEEKDNDE